MKSQAKSTQINQNSPDPVAVQVPTTHYPVPNPQIPLLIFQMYRSQKHHSPTTLNHTRPNLSQNSTTHSGQSDLCQSTLPNSNYSRPIFFPLTSIPTPPLLFFPFPSLPLLLHITIYPLINFDNKRSVVCRSSRGSSFLCSPSVPLWIFVWYVRQKSSLNTKDPAFALMRFFLGYLIPSSRNLQSFEHLLQQIFMKIY